MAKVKAEVKNIREVRKRMKRVADDALRERVVVSSAKRSARPGLRSAQMNIKNSVEGAGELASKMAIKKIPRRAGGREAPGAFIGLQNKNDFTIETRRGQALSLYWVEFGTNRRTQDSTGRDTGSFPAFSPVRSALRSNRSGMQRDFQNQVITSVNRQIKKNKL